MSKFKKLNIHPYFFGVCLILSLVFANSLAITLDLDLLWHYKLGEEIVSLKTITLNDSFSWQTGLEWLQQEWLYDLILYGIVALMQTFGLFLLYALNLMLTFYGGAFWGKAQNKIMYIFAAILTFFAIPSNKGNRPAEFSVWFIILIIWIWRNKKNHAPLWMFIISVFMANFHGGNIMTMTIVLAILAIIDIIWDFKGKELLSFKNELSHVLPILIFVAGSFINPSFAKMWKTSLSMQSWLSTPYIQEWKSWELGYLNGFIILLTVLSLGYACYKTHFERKVCQDTAIVCAFIIATMTTAKAGTILYIIFLVFAYQYIEQMCIDFFGPIKNKCLLSIYNYRPEVKMTMIACLIICFFVITSNNYEKNFTVLANEGHSQEIIETLQTTEEGTRIFNGYSEGNILLFNDIKCFIDSRQFPYATEYAGNESLNDYINIVHADIIDLEKTKAFIEKYDFDYIYNTQNTKQLEWYLDNEEHEYELVFENEETQESLWKKK